MTTPRRPTETTEYVLRLFRLTAWSCAALVLLAGLLLALTFPIHAIDALSYGEWSRLIGQTWNFRFPGIGAQDYHRPLFYALQGWLWGIFGFHEWIGRLLALFFTVLLVGSVAWLAARGHSRRTSAALAALLVCLVPDVLKGVASGLTDVPLAALVALTSALAFSRSLGRARPYVLAAAALATVLVKPTGLVGLVALALALLVGAQPGWRHAVRHSILPLAAGALVALVYSLVQAFHLGMGLMAFLTAGSTGFYADLARDSRFDQLVGLQWLGADLRPLVVYAVVYAVARVARCDHRVAVISAAVAAPVLSFVLPALGGGEIVSGPFTSTGSTLGFLALCVSLPLALWCPQEAIPEKEWLARFAILGLVPLCVWLWFGAYDTRLGSAAWPGLIALVALSFTPVLVGAAMRFPPAILVPGLALVAMLSYSYTDLDGLGKAQWSEVQRLGVSGIFDAEQTRNIVQPQVGQVVALLREQMGDTDRLASADGQFAYYFPGRLGERYPASCAALNGYRVFVLLTDEGTRAYMRDVAKVPFDPAYWASCRSPRLTQLSDGSGGYAVFRVER